MISAIANNARMSRSLTVAIVAWVATVPSVATARLGETAKACAERYGQALEVHRGGQMSNGLWMNYVSPYMTFAVEERDGTTVKCFFGSAEPTSKCHTVIYKGTDGDPDVISRLLEMESQGSQWLAPTVRQKENIGEVIEWRRKDGGSADYVEGVGLTIRSGRVENKPQ